MRVENARNLPVLESADDGLLAVDPQGQIIYSTQRLLQIWGLSHQVLEGAHLDWLAGQMARLVKDPIAFCATFTVGRSSGETDAIDVELQDGRILEMRSTPLGDSAGAGLGRAWWFRDVTEFRHATQERDATVHLLKLLSACETARQLADSLCGFLSERFKVGAVAIRLLDGHDYPYAQTTGLSPEFVAAESSLCVLNPDGHCAREADGRPTLACLCGRVIRQDAAGDPLLTASGSFVTGSTTDFLSRVTADQLGPHVRGRCPREGFESLALIPLRAGGRCLGLLQLCDHRRAAISPYCTGLLERLAEHISMALARVRAEEELRASEERFRRYFDLGLIGMAITSPQKECVEVNDEMCRILGYSREELLRRTWAEMTHPDDLAADVASFNRVMAGETDGFTLDKRWVRKDGQVINSIMSVSCLRRADRSVDYFVSLVQDVTKRKQAEEQLQILKRSIDNAPDVACWMDRAGRILYVNDEACRSLGYTRAELMGMNIVDINPRVTPDRWARAWKQAQEEGSYVSETLHRRKDGSTLVVEVSSWYARYGTSEYLCGFAKDITERKRVEAALYASERFVRATLDGLSDHIAIVDVNGDILAVNEAWNAFASANGPVLGNVGLGANYLVVCDRVCGEDAVSAHAFAQGVRDVLAGQKDIFEMEYPCHSPTERRWFVGRATRFPGDGPVHAVIAHQTITNLKFAEDELRRSESWLRRIVDSNMIGIVFADVATGVLLDANDAYLKIIGRTRAELRDGLIKWQDLTPPESLRLDHEAIEQASAKGVAPQYEKEYIRPDGTCVPVLMGGAFADEERTVAVGFTLDLTERKKSQAALRAAAQLAATGRLAAHVAHEINNPLAGIQNSFLLIKDAVPADHPYFHYVARIEKEIARIARIVQRMYNLHRPGPLASEEFDLGEAVNEVVEMIRLGTSKNVTVRICLPVQPLRVFLQEDALRQVMFNILRNAVDASSEGSEIVVSVELAGELHIAISDRGPGIPEELRSKIFEPFFTTKQGIDGAGLGLGLSVCYSLVEAIGGKIECQSTEGEGTTFHVHLPGSILKGHDD